MKVKVQKFLIKAMRLNLVLLSENVEDILTMDNCPAECWFIYLNITLNCY